MGRVIDLVREKLPEIIAVCRANGVRRLWLFGSATGMGDRPFTARSDVDLLVEFDPDADVPSGWSHPLFYLDEKLQPVLGRRVQITAMAKFNNPYFRQSIESNNELIYDDSVKEIAV